MKINILLIFLLIISYSCDCFVSINGRIISTTTGTPIEGAIVEMIDQNRKVITDSMGTFSITKHTGSCFDPTLRISKPNFKPFEIKIEKTTNANKYTITHYSESFNFDEPVYPDATDKSTFVVASWIEKFSQNFQAKDDSLIIFLDDDNIEVEKEKIKNRIKNSG